MLELNKVSLSARLQDASLQCKRSEWWTLLGPNGAGKSTLLSLASGILPANSGSLCLDGINFDDLSLSALAASRCLVTQSYRTEFGVSVAEALYFFTGMRVIPERLEQYLEIEALKNKSFERLSGGEKQRVHLARNLMQVWHQIESGNALVLLDEPLQQMDIRHQAATLSLIKSIQVMGNLIVMSHHDINQSLEYSTHLCLLKNGQIHQQGIAKEIVNKEALEHLYSQAFRLLKDDASSVEYYVVAP